MEGTMSPFRKISKPFKLTIILTVLCGWPHMLAAQQPWERGAFAGNPKDIAAAARLLADPGENVTVLLDETQIVLDAQHRATETHRLVYRIGSAPAEDWAVIAVAWQPWRQQRPSIRARVITADGREIALDPKALSETPAVESGVETYVDSRILRAPLPAVAPGSVVEQQWTVKDSQALLDRGVVGMIPFGKFVPVLRTTLTIQAPNSLPLRHEARRLPDVKPVIVSSGGRTTLTFQSGRLDALDPFTFLSNLSEPPQPYVAYSTAASWRDVAEAYARIAENRIRPSDVAAVTKEAVDGAATRDQIAERLLHRVQRTIRYAAVQLGEAAIVPTPPAETMRLAYGDCKDQAALLISMLRAAGIEAYMALLRAGPGPDVEPGLPGFGLFDHVIVYVPGERPFWIDSTSRYSRLGHLPGQDQGRLALIVKDDATQLVKTPEFPSIAISKHEVFLAEQGLGRIINTREFSGDLELDVRTMHSETPAADIERRNREFVKTLHGSAAVYQFKHSDPLDTMSPFVLRFDITGSETAQTSNGEAVFSIPAAHVLGEAGIGLLFTMDDKLFANGFRFPQTIAQEWRYRITPPPGYSKQNVPEDQTTRLGPAALSRAFSVREDGSVEGTVRVEIANKTFTSEDIRALKNAVEKIDEDPTWTVSFVHAAQAHLKAGAIRQALAEFRKLIAQAPGKALHHSELARALIGLGMGEAARSAARRAVVLEPRSAQAHAALAWVFQHDLAGRRWKPGFEYAEAREALRKAVELAPDDVEIRSEFALLLEHNPRGLRYGAGADLDLAIEQYRAIEDKLPSNSPLRRNLAYDLLMTGKYADVKGASTPADIRLAAIAMTDGPAAAVREAGKLDSSQRQGRLLSAESMLTELRQYPAAIELGRAVAAESPAGAFLDRVERLERLQRYDEAPLKADDPASAAKRFLVEALGDKRLEVMNQLLAADGREELRRRPDMRLEVSSIPMAGFPNLLGITQRASNPDVLVSSLNASHEGDDAAGYSVSFSGIAPFRLYVIREDGQYRVLTAGRNDFALARGALRHLDRGDLETAREWLDWAEEEVNLDRADPDRLSADAFFSIWFNSLSKTRDRMRYAAAAILSSSPDDAPAILPILVEGRKTTTGLVRDGVTLAHATALLTMGRYEESLAIGRQLLQASPRSRAIFLVADCMLELNRVGELKMFLQGKLKDAMDEKDVERLMAAVEVRAGDFSSAAARIKTLADSPGGRPVDQSYVAWLRLYSDSVTDNDIALAQKGAANVRALDFLNPQPQRTLAALYAEAGKTKEALAAFSQYLDRAGRAIAPDDWYILGRIYEHYGERDAAVAAYGRVPEPKGFPAVIDVSYALAQRGLQRLQNLEKK